MVALSLKIGVGNVVKTMQFEPSTMVYDACRIIRERVPEAQLGQPNDYGLFLSDEDPKKGIWLEAGKALDYYMLRNGFNTLTTIMGKTDDLKVVQKIIINTLYKNGRPQKV
uniref:Talin 1 n=1 Tax=Amphiprion percula TaxID=161767 RepID=A0A3P8T8H5_AMPPE